MKNALLQGRLDDFGELLHEGWSNKKKMAKQITTTTVDELYEAARAEGALGGKLLGAGGGGYLLVYCGDGKKHTIASALEKLGGQVVGFTFVRQGLQTWEVQSRDTSRMVVPQYNAT
jgi:D-glycero-alpha-D-manno-heptose-7-phosphate kinase